MSYHNPSDEDYDYPVTGMRPIRASTPSRSFWERQIERATAKLATLEQFGEDDYEENAVIRFDYQFVEGGTIYSYAALKSHGLWFGTGPKAPKAYTWDQLCTWWAEAKNTIEIWYVSEYMPHN